MKSLPFLPAFAVACIVLLACSIAQDGLMFKAEPPISYRFERGSFNGDKPKCHFTNTSDKILHEVTVWTAPEKDGGKPAPRIIIDTIEPHKTVTLPPTIDLLLGKHLTCKDYTKPIAFEAMK